MSTGLLLQAEAEAEAKQGKAKQGEAKQSKAKQIRCVDQSIGYDDHLRGLNGISRLLIVMLPSI